MNNQNASMKGFVHTVLVTFLKIKIMDTQVEFMEPSWFME